MESWILGRVRSCEATLHEDFFDIGFILSVIKLRKKNRYGRRKMMNRMIGDNVNGI